MVVTSGKGFLDLMPKIWPKELPVTYDPFEKYQYGTYSLNRRPEFKIHTSLARARNALTVEDSFILFQWDVTTSKWVELSRVKKFNDIDECQICTARVTHSWWNSGRKWVGENCLRVCEKCQ